MQVLELCCKAGLATLGHVALKPAPAQAGGTKIKANASQHKAQHKAMSYRRRRAAAETLAAEVAAWLKQAAMTDAAEDRQPGCGRRGDETPAWVASTHMQREASIEDQIRLCRSRIEQEGWDYLDAYTDRAVSGTSALRPAYQSLMEDARRGEFEIVAAEALDRLSRDQEDVAGLLKRLRFAGVRLFTLAEGEIGELHVGFKGTMNALFLKDLADKTCRGVARAG